MPGMKFTRESRGQARLRCELEFFNGCWKSEMLRRGFMDLDTNKIDDAVLALLYLGLHDGMRAWRGFD